MSLLINLVNLNAPNAFSYLPPQKPWSFMLLFISGFASVPIPPRFQDIIGLSNAGRWEAT